MLTNVPGLIMMRRSIAEKALKSKDQNSLGTSLII